MRSLPFLVLTVVAVGIAACSERSDPVGAGNDNQLEASKKQTVYDVTQLSSLGGIGSSGNGISNSGLVAGSSNLPGDGAAHAALWRNGTLIDLGTLGGPNSNSAWPGINSKGMVVGIAETSEPVVPVLLSLRYREPVPRFCLGERCDDGDPHLARWSQRIRDRGQQ
jgi:probable HAF family extracellular repeat protein